jgi:dTDP-glucose pyrophosphorylase
VDAIETLLRDGYRVETVHHDGWRMNINRPEDVDAAENHLRFQSE